MCGILGIWNLDGRPIDLASLQRATTVLRHRGPDDEGYLLLNTDRNTVSHCGGVDTLPALTLPRIEHIAKQEHNFGFGFRRLSIIDLSPAGHQPMKSEDGRLWIVFNGEIYNYLELRSELAGHGFTFRTHSDTEVILAAYQKWGHECLTHFNGMWALAIWDADKQELFCARDRLGVKPFYYYFEEGCFIFASEIKAILAIQARAAEVNHACLAHFLMTGLLDVSNQTFFARVQSLRPAHFLTLDTKSGTISQKRFWDVVPEKIQSSYDYESPHRTFLELLQDSVRLRLRSDVPVGTCLSGGIDSSAIASLSAQLLPGTMNSFSSIYSHAGYSEESYIQIVTKMCGLHSHLTSPDPAPFFELLRKITFHMDEPMAGPGVYSQWFVMQLASQSVTVLLDGQGGDELFAGYFPYLPLYLRSLFAETIAGRRLDLIPRLLRDSFIILRDARRYFFPELTTRQFLLKTARRLSGKRYRADLVLNPDLAKALSNQFVADSDSPLLVDPLNRRLYRDVTRDSIPALLHYEDRNSMAFGLEARIPLLDYRIVEFALGLPGEAKIKGATTKYFMRQALKGILPEAVRTRRDKMGYPTPLALWLRDQLGTQTEELLQQHFRRRNFYNLTTVKRMWQDHKAGAADNSWHIFRWLTTEMWMQNFIDGGTSMKSDLRKDHPKSSESVARKSNFAGSVAMLLSNAFRPDPRVHKEAQSLVQAGYKVTVICWDRNGELPAREQMDGFEIRRIAVRSGYGVGSRQIFYLPRFWRLAFQELRRLQPDVVHCHDLDTAPLGYWYAKAKGLPWILDAHECYPEQARGIRVNRAIYHLLLFLERQLTRRATHVITVGKLLAQRFHAMGGCASVVGNYQPLSAFASTHSLARADLGLRTDEFVVAYIGGFTLGRVIMPLIKASQYAPEVTILLLGDGPQRAAVESELSTHPRVRYLGLVPQEQVPNYTSLVDVIYYGLDGMIKDDNIHYSSPNALFNALAAGKPVLTTNLGEIARIVREERCGIVVEQPTPMLLAEAMLKLRDPAFREPLSINARRAAQLRYNWEAAESTLLNVYRQLVVPG